MISNNIKAVFIDLDHTLWDLEKNAQETLTELFEYYDFQKHTDAKASEFIERFSFYNKMLWEKYNLGEIKKAFLREERFKLALDDIKIPENLRPQNMWATFLNKCPDKTNLMPHAIETLDYLTGKYPLYLITNGFVETQHRKLNNSGLDKYFKGLIISEETGFQKPMKEIYDLAVNKANIAHHQSVMIGDSISADVEGALNAGLHAVYYNPDRLEIEKPKKAVEINSLLELTYKL